MVLHGYHVPAWIIDKVLLLMCSVVFGDTARHGLHRPAVGPFTMKLTTPGYPVIDVGTYGKIKSGEIQVLTAGVKSVHGNVVEFADGKRHPFDVIVFATGYRSTVKRWLKVRDVIVLILNKCMNRWQLLSRCCSGRMIQIMICPPDKS